MSDFDQPIEEQVVDIDTRTNDELRAMIDDLQREEKEVSYRRRILHGKIDILRAELVRRLKDQHDSGADPISGDDIDRLVKILSNEVRPIMEAGEDTGTDD